MKEKRRTKVTRIDNIHFKKLNEIGEGNVQTGIARIISIYESVKKNPEEVCMNHISDFMDDVQKYYGDNHSSHLANLPAMIRAGLRRGGTLDPRILNKRHDKDINEFVEG